MFVCAVSDAHSRTRQILQKELADLESKDPATYERMLAASYEALSNAGAHYVIDDISHLPRVIDDINRRLAQGEVP